MLFVHSWPRSAITAWPLQPAPLTAYTTHGLNLLTPAQPEPSLEAAAIETKPVKASVPADNSKSQQATVNVNLPQLLQPQFVTPHQPYFVLNSPYYGTPFAQYAYTTTASNPFLPQFVQPLTITAETEKLTQSSTTTTRKPKVKDTEPTTKRPQGALKSKPPKLQLKPKATNTPTGDFSNDAPLLQAVRQINSEFVIEEIRPVPGQHIFSSVNKENISAQNTFAQKVASSKVIAKKQNSKISNKKSLKLNNASQVKVESIGRTATSGNIPQIPFGTYFLPYFSQGQQLKRSKGVKMAALILEPHSKAIVGNGGTAISTPISKAYLKRGVATNVYFNPESVAIAGVGGKAHAQADLELDLID